jgi:hypothetical protein
MNWKGYGGKQSWPNLRQVYCPVIYLEAVTKQRESSEEPVSQPRFEPASPLYKSRMLSFEESSPVAPVYVTTHIIIPLKVDDIKRM